MQLRVRLSCWAFGVCLRTVAGRRWGQHNVAKGKIQSQDYPTLSFGEAEHAPSTGPDGVKFGPGDWNEYWPVDMSAYVWRKSCPPHTPCGLAFACTSVVGQNRNFTVSSPSNRDPGHMPLKCLPTTDIHHTFQTLSELYLRL